MNRMSFLVVCAVVFLGNSLGSAAAETDPLGQANPLPASLERKVQDLRHVLEADGYETARGYWDLWTAEDCKFPLQTIGNCYGNNPTAPYVLAMLPHWNDEFVDRRMHHALAQGQRNMAPNYRLGEREALVILAEIPPPARYFGLGTNVFTRQAELNKDDPVYVKLDQPETQDLLGIIFGASPNPEFLPARAGDVLHSQASIDRARALWGFRPVVTVQEGMARTVEHFRRTSG